MTAPTLTLLREALAAPAVACAGCSNCGQPTTDLTRMEDGQRLCGPCFDKCPCGQCVHS